ncbi:MULTISPECIES: hypothetical protein [Chryseobacterium]|uniref:Helix-turn-helix domain-containing protein n=1 Tax=Candidatus Chryseobacterium massiliense TaxID=204089 RepID=A0A3D9BAD6_9FLAO|nr:MULTISPECIES: hypothetical protein [Chryseobacterium]REC50620.1 hypothetical protein DRF68_08990 [Candidatus Chryseobacterium massiliae]
MYYFELIQRFWDFNQRNPVGSTGISMYMYLLKIGYDNNRYDFHISDVTASKELGLTRKTVKSIKEQLRDFGLIEFKTKNGLPCYYRLLLDYPLQIAETEKKKNIKIAKNLVASKSEDIEIPAKQKSLTPLINQKDIPSFEEFIGYAETLETYDSELDFRIKEKYEEWVMNGWQNSSNRSITNWKAALKSILPYMKNTDNGHQLSVINIPSIKRPKN